MSTSGAFLGRFAPAKSVLTLFLPLRIAVGVGALFGAIGGGGFPGNGSSRLCAQSPRRVAPSSRVVAPSPRLIPRSELAGADAPVKKLIADGNVKFVYGPRSEDATRSSTLMDAETKYRIAYRYRSQNQWTLRRDGGARRLVIKARFSKIDLVPEHEIWFRIRPPTETFWEDRLVRHELDHVRISTDPRLRARFGQLLRSRSEIVTTLEPGAVVNDEVVSRLVDRRVKEVFGQIDDLVAIRYRELDRVTRHGADPVPPQSALRDWLSLGRPVSD